MIRKNLKRSARITRYVIYRETLIDSREHFWSFLGSFIAIGLIAFIQSRHTSASDNLFLIGSFGASSVLVYGAIQSPLAQPKNLIGGHVVSALTGVSVHLFLPDVIWIAAPLAVSLSIVLMQITKTLHPPGRATALLAVIGSEKIKALGYWYVLSPVLSGTSVLLLVALVFNNITRHRNYPSSNTGIGTVKKLFVRKREE